MERKVEKRLVVRGRFKIVNKFRDTLLDNEEFEATRIRLGQQIGGQIIELSQKIEKVGERHGN